ncbi:MAG: shikimate kinase [Bacteroidia bacterium]|nr:shikimate kinase [Bacteroidia bacterium]
MVICLTGFMGCGKSRVGYELSKKLGLRFVDLDRAITLRTGKSIEELFESGEAYFRSVELDTLRAVLSRSTGDSIVLALGGGTVTTPEALDIILSRTTSFYLKSSFERISANLAQSSVKRPLFNADAASLLASREPLYEKAAFTIETDDKTPQMIAAEITALLER